MDPSVDTLLAAARRVRDAQDASDEVWTEAHERLYAAVDAAELLAAEQAAGDRPLRRGSNWRPSDLTKLAGRPEA